MIPQLIAVLAPDGQALYVNQSTLEYTGLSPDQARGFEFRQRVFHPEDVERLRAERGSALERGEPFENEQRAKRQDGVYRWFLSFDAYCWQFVDGRPRQNRWKSLRQIPATTAESDAFSRELKRRGFSFVGSTVIYAHMQAVGMVNDHLIDCYRYRDVRRLGTPT